MIDWTLSIKTVSEANNTDHWLVKRRRKQLQEHILWVKWMQERPTITLPCTVELTRLGSKFLDEDDNLPMAFKALKDKIADLIIPCSEKRLCKFERKSGEVEHKFITVNAGKSDGDKRITWKYSQEKSPIRKVRIRIYGQTDL